MANEDTSSKSGTSSPETATNNVNDVENLAGGEPTHKNLNRSQNNKTSPKTNTLSVVGLIFAFFVPLVGLICSIISLSQIKKRQEKGKGLAIAGIIISIIVGLLQIITLVLIVITVNSSNITLKTYRDNAVGYSVKYPEGWNISPQNVEGAKGIVINKSTDETGKVVGQVEVGYFATPANGWSKDILQAIADGIKNNKNNAVLYEDRGTKNGLETLTLITTYDGENGKIKAKTSIILKKDKSVFMINTQTPEQNWDKYKDSFDEIHNTFSPN